MKKIIKTVTALAVVFMIPLLTACSLFLTKTELVNKQTMTSQVTLSKLVGSSKKSLTAAAYKAMKQENAPFKNLAGVTQKLSRKGDKATQTISIDYTKVNMKKLKNAEGAGLGTKNTVSLKQSVGELKAAGYEQQ